MGARISGVRPEDYQYIETYVKVKKISNRLNARKKNWTASKSPQIEL